MRLFSILDDVQSDEEVEDAQTATTAPYMMWKMFMASFRDGQGTCMSSLQLASLLAAEQAEIAEDVRALGLSETFSSVRDRVHTAIDERS